MGYVAIRNKSWCFISEEEEDRIGLLTSSHDYSIWKHKNGVYSFVNSVWKIGDSLCGKNKHSLWCPIDPN